MNDRKLDHIRLTNKSQSSLFDLNDNFQYEPMLGSLADIDISCSFLGKKLDAPIWISSMTGGTGEARYINQNLSKVAGEHKIGLGLGSCRSLLTSDRYFEDFNLVSNMNGAPFWANLGIAQLENSIRNNNISQIEDLVESLNVDGLIIHVNPLQEWFQPEGDIIEVPPIETIQEFLSSSNVSIIVKEVGHGFGPESLSALMSLPISAIEFAGFGGTNFSKLESIRDKSFNDVHSCLMNVGHNAMQMIEMSNEIIDKRGHDVKCQSFIISGGIRDYLTGYELIEKSKGNAVFAMASPFLTHAAQSEDALNDFVTELKKGLKVARSFLKVKVSK